MQGFPRNESDDFYPGLRKWNQEVSLESFISWLGSENDMIFVVAVVVLNE